MRFSICAFLNLCDSQLVLFSISVFLNLCDSQLVFFSICAILNLCDSQLVFFSIKAVWARHPMLYFKIPRTKKCSIAMCYPDHLDWSKEYQEGRGKIRFVYLICFDSTCLFIFLVPSPFIILPCQSVFPCFELIWRVLNIRNLHFCIGRGPR